MCNRLSEELREAIDMVVSEVGQRTYLARREKGDSRESADSKAVIATENLRSQLENKVLIGENGR
jgi:hypothetical protein